MSELVDLCFLVVPSDYTFLLVIDKTRFAAGSKYNFCRNSFFLSLLDNSTWPCLPPSPAISLGSSFQHQLGIMSDQEKRSVGKFLLIEIVTQSLFISTIFSDLTFK